MTIKTDEDDEKVLAAVQAQPGITAREIAAYVFGGTGLPRTPSRGRAYHSLTRLEEAGKVKATRRACRSGHEHCWRAVEIDRDDDPSIGSHGAGMGA